MGEIRNDPLTGQTVILAPQRAERPGLRQKAETRACPFCAGSEAMTPLEVYRVGEGKANGPGWDVRVVPNKFALLDGHEVIIHSPNHDRDVEDLPQDQAVKILQTYRSRYRSHTQRGCQPFIFNNTGGGSGASLSHPHSQLVPFGDVPDEIKRELDGAEKYYREHQSCYFCGLIAKEIDSQERIVLNGRSLVLITPKVSRWPYEVMLLPKRHNSSFGAIGDEEIEEAASVLQKLLKAFDRLFGTHDRNFWIHSVATGGNRAIEQSNNLAIEYHWHIEFFPRLKIFGGVELGGGVMVNDRISPEEAAQKLRQAF